MATWKNLDTLETFKALSEVKRVKLAEVMSGAEVCRLLLEKKSV